MKAGEFAEGDEYFEIDAYDLGPREFEFGELVFVLTDELSEFGEQPSTLHGGQAPPLSVQCGLRRLDGTVDIARSPTGDLIKHLSGAGINDRQRGSRVRSLPLVLYENFS